MGAVQAPALRAQMERTLTRLLAAADLIIAEMDAEDGNPDLEDGADLEQVCEDEGGACEDEGVDSGDREPDQFSLCNWQDEGDQTVLRQLPTICARR